MSNAEPTPAENIITRFADRVQAMIHDAALTQLEQIEQAAALVARTVESGGLVHTLGTGHSHLLAEEIYSRAGGLLPVNVIESAPLMLHEDALASGQWERVSGIAKIMLEHAALDPSRDVLIVISNSGRNSVPVEAAEWARAHQIPVIAVTSYAHSRAETSLAPSGKKLYEVADVVLDNLGQSGDAEMTLAQGVRTGATSDIIGGFLLHALVLRGVELLLERGHEPPVFVSGNVTGAREANQRMIAQYPGRLAPAYERVRTRR